MYKLIALSVRLSCMLVICMCLGMSQGAPTEVTIDLVPEGADGGERSISVVVRGDFVETNISSLCAVEVADKEIDKFRLDIIETLSRLCSADESIALSSYTVEESATLAKDPNVGRLLGLTRNFLAARNEFVMTGIVYYGTYYIVMLEPKFGGRAETAAFVMVKTSEGVKLTNVLKSDSGVALLRGVVARRVQKRGR
jgi:hypothetical protein